MGERGKFMAAVVTKTYLNYPGAVVEFVGTVALDNSYPTGGYSIALNQFGLQNRVDILLAEDAKGYGFEWDYTNKKLKAYSTGGTEVTNATDLSAITALHVLVRGV